MIDLTPETLAMLVIPMRGDPEAYRLQIKEVADLIRRERTACARAVRKEAERILPQFGTHAWNCGKDIGQRLSDKILIRNRKPTKSIVFSWLSSLLFPSCLS